MNNYESSRYILEQQDSLIREASRANLYQAQIMQHTWTTNKVSFFNKSNQSDSTIFYLEKLFQLLGAHPVNTLWGKRIYAELLFEKGNKEKAYEVLKSIYDASDSLHNRMLTEQQEMQYAYIQAEESQEALLQAEKEKFNRTLIIAIVSLLSIIAISLIYWFLTRKNKIARNRIQELNNTANIQVALMEGMKYKAVKEEQQRLGRDLHDDISSSLASVKLRLEQLKVNEEQHSETELNNVLNQIEKIYQKVRNKSHEWYKASDDLEEKLFSAQIASLVNTILPDTNYTVNVDIDNASLKHTNTDMRIELLRIIQEGITNIVRHAQAKTISILLFEDRNHIVLSIKDDGIGFNPKNLKKGLGLQSITDRIQNLGGTISFLPVQPSGTEVLIEVPFR